MEARGKEKKDVTTNPEQSGATAGGGGMAELTRAEKYFGDIIFYFVLGVIVEIINCSMSAFVAVAMFTFSAISLMKWLKVRNTYEGNQRWRD